MQYCRLLPEQRSGREFIGELVVGKGLMGLRERWDPGKGKSFGL